MKRTKYSKELLEEKVKNCYSFADLARSLGLKPEGSNPRTLRKKLIKFGVDFSHFTGHAWNNPNNPKFSNGKIPLEKVFNNEFIPKSSNLKNRLFRYKLKEEKCEECGITEWNGKPISFHLHHINGNHDDNRLENLKILCPNCHSQTESYCKRYEIRPSGEIGSTQKT